jgi:uncharacterized membrane protein YeiH
MRPGPQWFILIETIGILSLAINTMIAGWEENLSAMGIFLCTVIASFGGGTVRDILLGSPAQSFFWVTHPFYIVAIFAISMGYAHLALVRLAIRKRNLLLKEMAETIAFASLGAAGAAKTFTVLSAAIGSGGLASLQLIILCAFLGSAGAAFGSIIRDLLIGAPPAVLRPGVWSLESLFTGSALLAGLRMAGVPEPWALLAGFVAILAAKSSAVLHSYLRAVPMLHRTPH